VRSSHFPGLCREQCGCLLTFTILDARHLRVSHNPPFFFWWIRYVYCTWCQHVADRCVPSDETFSWLMIILIEPANQSSVYSFCGFVHTHERARYFLLILTVDFPHQKHVYGIIMITLKSKIRHNPARKVPRQKMRWNLDIYFFLMPKFESLICLGLFCAFGHFML
jgi:hypothetical protein